MIGHVLNERYRLEEMIGEGATATVYRGMDLRLRRTVAIKLLLPQVQASTRTRFEQEAYASARLNHPGIMTIYDVGSDRNQHYLVVELVEGHALYDYIPCAPDLAAKLGVQVCLALDYAHRSGLIHRDIKPANVFVTKDGVKIMDFGLAIPTDGSRKRLTASGSVIGTPAYLSPEQAQGKPLDPRTDLYSFAVVLYEMVTGQLPFDSEDITAILLMQVNKAPVPPSQLNPSVPGWLENVIMRALEKLPENRFASAAEMASALQAKELEMSNPSRPSRKPMIRVVLADDHAMMRTGLAAQLELSGEVEIVGEASNGEDAIRLTTEYKPDVVLLDINMPKMTGLRALPEIKRIHPAARVVILTGRDETPYIMEALRNGANGYILKTAEEADLIKAVKDVYAGGLVLGQGIAEKIVDGLKTLGNDPLTADEHDVLRVIAAGHEDNARIATKLNLDEQKVITTVARIVDKLGVSNRSEAALMAIRAGWILIDEIQRMA